VIYIAAREGFLWAEGWNFFEINLVKREFPDKRGETVGTENRHSSEYLCGFRLWQRWEYRSVYSVSFDAVIIRNQFGIYDCLNCFERYSVYVNKYPTRCNYTPFILSVNCSGCFGWFLHPSSGAQITVLRMMGGETTRNIQSSLQTK